MRIFINQEYVIELDPSVFTLSKSFLMSDRIEDMKKAEISPREVLHGYLSMDDIQQKHNGLNLIVCLAFNENIIEYKHDNSNVSVFLNKYGYILSKYEPLDKIQVNLMNEGGKTFTSTLSKEEIVSVIKGSSISPYDLADPESISIRDDKKEIIAKGIVIALDTLQSDFNEKIFDKKIVNLLYSDGQCYSVDFFSKSDSRH